MVNRITLKGYSGLGGEGKKIRERAEAREREKVREEIKSWM